MSTHLRTLRTAAWLGWQYSSNWTDPWLFAIYSIIKPVAGTLILVTIFLVAAAAGGAAPPEMLAYIFVGSAFYMFVFQAFFGMFEVIQGDREWFQTIRYIYISPISYYVYIIGRGFTQMVVAGIGVLIVLVIGRGLLGIPIGFNLALVPFFLAVLFLGLFLTIAIGVAIGGITFLTARHGGGMSEGIAGVFYVFTGVIFPLSVLPVFGQVFGQWIPLTYWFEGLRRVLLTNPPPQADAFLLVIPETTLLLILAVSLIVVSLLSLAVFRYVEHLARKKGRIDMTTAY
ncbi:MAG: ABC transporter permease [Thermoplasmata archaeon]